MKIQHPEFPSVTKTIESKAAAAKWLKAGWVEVAEKGAKKTTAPSAPKPDEKPAT